MSSSNRKTTVMDASQVAMALERIAQETVAAHSNLDKMRLVGIRTGGAYLAQRLQKLLEQIQNRRTFSLPAFVGEGDASTKTGMLDARLVILNSYQYVLLPPDDATLTGSVALKGWLSVGEIQHRLEGITVAPDYISAKTKKGENIALHKVIQGTWQGEIQTQSEVMQLTFQER